MYALLKYLPRNHLSYLFGRIASVRLPTAIQARLNTAFARFAGADLSEAAHPPEAYRSLAEFFLRDLKEGIRPMEEGVVSPVDALIVEHGEISEGTLIQAKGKRYTLERLVRDRELADAFSEGYFITLYLSPKDYHHIHAPLDARVTACYYIPGTLWPVNSWSVANIDELFCVNERLITLLDTGTELVAVVKVGATNVGSISVTYDSIRSNTLDRLRKRFPGVVRRRYSPAQAVSKGERLGSFHLGSTVILLFQRGSFRPGEHCTAGPIRLGRRLSA